MLLELAKGAGRRQTTLSQRNEVADAQFRAEEQIHLVNRQIYYCQFLIGIGKLAEAGLGVYGWIPKVKGTVDGMKRIVDAAKAVQPIAAEVVAATTGGRSNATAANAAAVIAQLLAIMMRFDDDLRALGTLVWNNVGAIRRPTSIKDAWSKASAIAHALKTVLDNLKQLVELTDRAIEVSTAYNGAPIRAITAGQSGMAALMGGLANGVGILRDLIDAGRAFAAMLEAQQEMDDAMEGMWRETAQGIRFIGSEQAALLYPPNLNGIRSQEDIDRRLAYAYNYNNARVLADEARREAARIAADMVAIASLKREHVTQLRSAAQKYIRRSKQFRIAWTSSAR